MQKMKVNWKEVWKVVKMVGFCLLIFVIMNILINEQLEYLDKCKKCEITGIKNADNNLFSLDVYIYESTCGDLIKSYKLRIGEEVCS